MTLRAPEAGELDRDRIAGELLRHLRTEAGLERAAFDGPPIRVMGGFETLIYAFQLTGAPPKLAGPLVVRVFPETGGVRQAKKEAVFQNAVAATGYPAPRVVVPGSERVIGGRAFNVMERVRGHSLMEDLLADPAAAPRVADQLAQTLADLHELRSSPVADSLRDAGIPAHEATLAGRLRYLQPYVADRALAHLEPGMAWLLENQLSERDVLSVCHGDFHPGNVMVDDGRVTGVLDWPGGQLADPEYDVAVSLVLVAVAGPTLAEGVPAGTFEAFADRYVEAYSRRRALDSGRLSFYRAYRVLRAFLRGTAARTPGVAPELLPRDQYPWAAAGTLRRLAGVFQEITGIALPLPSGVEPE